MPAYDQAEGLVSEFMGGPPKRDPGLAWTDLENLLIKEYADDEIAIEAMRSLMKLTQAGDETPGELGAKAMRLSAMAFPEEVKQNAAIQVHLANLFIDALENENNRHDVIKEASIRLSVVIDLAKDSRKRQETVEHRFKLRKD